MGIGTRGAAIAAAATLFTSVGAAHAEDDRRIQLGLIGGFVTDDLLAERSDAVPRGYLAASLAWDRPPPDYPAAPGYAFRGDLVPELVIARAGPARMLLAGVRLELDVAPLEQGLRRASARASFYAAPRIGVVRGARGAALGIDVGLTFEVGRSGWSFGYGFGLIGWERAPGYVIQADGDGDYRAQIVPPPGGWPTERTLVFTGYLTLASRL